MLEEIRETLDTVFADRHIRFEGLVEKTKSRVGTEIVDVLRKVTQERNFTPVTYQGGILAFILLESEMTFNSNRTGLIEATLVVLSDRYGDHKTIIGALNSYSFPEVKLLLDSQGIYNKYFVESDNKPFSNYAFEMKLQFSDNYSLCCESFTKC